MSTVPPPISTTKNRLDFCRVDASSIAAASVRKAQSALRCEVTSFGSQAQREYPRLRERDYDKHILFERMKLSLMKVSYITLCMRFEVRMLPMLLMYDAHWIVCNKMLIILCVGGLSI